MSVKQWAPRKLREQYRKELAKRLASGDREGVDWLLRHALKEGIFRKCDVTAVTLWWDMTSDEFAERLSLLKKHSLLPDQVEVLINNERNSNAT